MRTTFLEMDFWEVGPAIALRVRYRGRFEIVLTAIAEFIARGAAHFIWLLRSLPNALFAAIAWTIIALGLWQVIAAGRETVRRSMAMHEIPCAGCQFFTNDHRLKCPVHPHEALTLDAVGCRDFETPSGT